jgi:lipopolysaccharide transport system ATP-binding protein
MYSRLAFAIAINVDPDVLIVDEALAVGDETFQRKCFARMEEIKRDGATILFVSHASTSIVNLCDRAILLHEGSKLYMGKPKTVIDWYQKLMNAPDHVEEIREKIASLESSDGLRLAADDQQPSGQLFGDEPASFSAPGNGSATSPPRVEDDQVSFDPGLVSESRLVYEPRGAQIENPRIESLDGAAVNLLRNGERYRVSYQVQFHRNCDRVRFRCMIKTPMGVALGGGTYPEMLQSGADFTDGQSVQVAFDFVCNLNPGTYFINCGLSGSQSNIHRIVDAIVFKVLQKDESYSFGTVDFGFRSLVELDTSGLAKQ